MPSNLPRVLIVGAGHAGGRVAESLRERGFDGNITLVGSEQHPPYERPPLSKHVLLGRASPLSTYLRPTDWWNDAKVDFQSGVTAIRLDSRSNAITLGDTRTLSYDVLVLATGSRPRPLPAGVGGSARLFYLRDMDDALRLKSAIKAGGRIVVLGGGLIGLEVAAAAIELGAQANVVEASPHILARVALPQIAVSVQSLHEDRGVVFHCNRYATRIESLADTALVMLSDGTRLEADAIIVGIGSIPNTQIADGTDLALSDGIVADEHGRTNIPNIFATGDVTFHYNAFLGRHIRQESWLNAQSQSSIVAGAIMGDVSPYDELPWFWSDQHDMNFQWFGSPSSYDAIVWRGSPNDNCCTAFLVNDKVVVGAQSINPGRDGRFIKELVRRNQAANIAELQDIDLRLRSILDPKPQL